MTTQFQRLRMTFALLSAFIWPLLRDRLHYIFFGLCILFGVAVSASAQTKQIDWLDGYTDVRYGVVDGVVWAYWYGFDGDGKSYVRRRLIDPAKLGRDAIDAARAWAAGTNPSLPSAPASLDVWTDPATDAAHDQMTAEINLEIMTGKVPAWQPWRVAPNLASTSTPPTRPMWTPDATKYAAERATVGAVCNCLTRVTKGTQVLCPLRSTATFTASLNLAACTK